MKTLTRALAITLGLSASFGFGFLWKDIRNGQLGSAQKDLLLGIKTPGKAASAESLFKQSFSRILSSHKSEQDRKELKYSAMAGLVASLGDPHSNFFVQKINTAIRDDTSGKFYGIGARLLPDPLGVKVVAVFKDGPAIRGGIKGEDVIVEVDGKRIAGMNSDDIILLIKGKENTFVKLKIMRPGKPEPLVFNLRREKVVPPLVEGKLLEGSNVGYLKIASFSQEVPEQFIREWEALDKGNLKGLVIDLRDNPGGALDAVVDMLGAFIDDRLAVTLKDREGGEEKANTPGGQIRQIGYDVAVLINEDSASAAEIMAGVLQDYKKAILVGDTSYGKFSVQTVFQQSDGAGIKLTIAKYYLPKQGALSRKVDDDGIYISGGLKPDLAVAPDPDQEFESGNPKKDNQLAKAVEAITKR